MAESSYKTIEHGQVNAFIFPLTVKNGWTALATPDLQFAEAQLNRATSVGVGAFDVALRKRKEVGRTDATQKVSSSSVDKPVTLEWLEHGDMRPWNNLAGQSCSNTADITQADFDSSTSECCIVVHKLDDDKTNVISSDVIWRCVVDTPSVSVPNSQDDDVRCSVRLTGDHHVMASGDAGRAIVFLETAAGSAVALPGDSSTWVNVVERDDWSDDDDGTNERTWLTQDPAAAATTLDIYDETGFSAGQYIIVRSTENLWETTTVASTVADGIVTNDEMDHNHVLGGEVARTRGFFLFVYNQTSGEYLEAGVDYRVKKTDADNIDIINVDGGTAIGATDELWIAWLMPSGAELWTDDDTQLYGVTHPMCKFVIAPEATFVATTVGLDGTAVTEDTDFEFASTGTSAVNEWASFEFVPTATGKVANVQAMFNRAGTGGNIPVGQIFACIYSNTGIDPNAQIGNPSVPINASDLTLTDTLETFYFTDGPDVTSGTTYHIVWKTLGYTLGATNNITWSIEDAPGAGTSAVRTADPNGGGAGIPSWALFDEESSSAEVNVNLIGSRWIRRIQGMDMSVTFSRSAFYEMGSETTVERPHDDTDARITIPKLASDDTTWSLAIDKNPASVKTARPEQNPVVWARLEVYSTVDKNAGDILTCYEFPQVQRSGGEKTTPSGERSTERITLQGDQFTIATAL